MDIPERENIKLVRTARCFGQYEDGLFGILPDFYDAGFGHEEATGPAKVAQYLLRGIDRELIEQEQTGTHLGCNRKELFQGLLGEFMTHGVYQYELSEFSINSHSDAAQPSTPRTAIPNKSARVQEPKAATAKHPILEYGIERTIVEKTIDTDGQIRTTPMVREHITDIVFNEHAGRIMLLGLGLLRRDYMWDPNMQNSYNRRATWISDALASILHKA